MHLGDNLSRHSPILLKIKVGVIPRKIVRPTVLNMKRPAWYKATDQDIDHFTGLVHDKLEGLHSPESLKCNNLHCTDPSHKLDRDNHMLDVLGTLIESSYTAIPKTKPSGKARKEKDLSGWNEHVEPFRSGTQCG